MSLINCEMNSILTRSESCVISDSTTQNDTNLAVSQIRAPKIVIFKTETQNCMSQLLLYQLKMIIIRAIKNNY